MNVDLINAIIKNFFIVLFTNFIMLRLLNIKEKNIKNVIIITLFSMFLSTIYVIIKLYADSILALVCLVILLTLFSEETTKNKTRLFIITTLISLALCFISFGLSAAVNYGIINLLKINNNYFNLFSIIIIQGLLIYGFFRIKRFKNGFSFLQKTINNDFIDIIMINIATIIIFVYAFSGNYNGDDLTKHTFTIFITLGIIMIITIQKILIQQYKQNLLKRTIEEYKKEIKDKEEIINKLSKEKFNISKLNHEFYNRQQALELKVKEMTLEAGEEIGILDRINNLTNEYSENLEKIKGMSKLPLTDISEIDDMFKYMQVECYNNNIDFKLQIEENIYKLVNNIIPKNKLETLIGDHIRDAIIAVNSSYNKYKSILVILGIKDNCYELCIYDSGIEFEIETLLKLGLESITTHKEDGGTGIGFVTTFETLKECRASLIIQERHKETDNDYTKAVIFRFDNKNEYKIYSYRSDEIKKYSSDDRIIIKNLEVK